MKNVNIPKDRLKAIAEGRIEFATTEAGEKRSHIIQFVNILRGLELRGVTIPTGQPLDIESILKQVESRGLVIPSKPFTSLSKKEQRSFSDTLSGITIPSITDNMTPRQKNLYSEFLHYKAGDTKDFRGNWIKNKM